MIKATLLNRFGRYIPKDVWDGEWASSQRLRDEEVKFWIEAFNSAIEKNDTEMAFDFYQALRGFLYACNMLTAENYEILIAYLEWAIDNDEKIDVKIYEKCRIEKKDAKQIMEESK